MYIYIYVYAYMLCDHIDIVIRTRIICDAWTGRNMSHNIPGRASMHLGDFSWSQKSWGSRTDSNPRSNASRVCLRSQSCLVNVDFADPVLNSTYATSYDSPLCTQLD